MMDEFTSRRLLPWRKRVAPCHVEPPQPLQPPQVQPLTEDGLSANELRFIEIANRLRVKRGLGELPDPMAHIMHIREEARKLPLVGGNGR